MALGSAVGCKFLLCIALVSCQSTHQDEPLDYDEEAAISPYPHPRKPTSWATTKLLLTHDLPDVLQIEQCFDEVSSLAGDTFNDSDILNAKLTLARSVAQRPKLYHWCFYKMMDELDSQLEKSEFTFQQKSTVFLQEMKKLWLLSRAIRESLEEDSCFQYLQKRYILLSKQAFGRNLAIVSVPIDERIEAKIGARKRQMNTPADDLEYEENQNNQQQNQENQEQGNQVEQADLEENSYAGQDQEENTQQGNTQAGNNQENDDQEGSDQEGDPELDQALE